jgi:Right handed beta helix region/Secretion system C-terminal sorting domain
VIVLEMLMFKSLILLYVIIFSVFAFSSPAFATVHHSWVDDDATDVGLGTEEQPYHHINDALRYVSGLPAGDVVHVHVLPGVYRETIAKSGWDDDLVDVIIEGDPIDRPVIKGSDVFLDWSNFGGSIYNADWPHDFFTGTPPYNPNNQNSRFWLYGNNPNNTYRATYLSRREAVWVDGHRLRQVLSREETVSGAFMVNQITDRLLVWLENDGRPRDHRMEASVRQYGVNFSQMNNITLRNLEFRHCQTAVYASWVNSLTVENCLITENVNEGIMIGRSEGLTIRNSHIERNGFNGVQPSFTYNVCMEDVNVWDNNWRGALVNAGNWRVGGIKFYGVSNVYMNNVDARNNRAAGVWFDRYCDTVWMEECKMIANYGSGLFWEISPGPITLDRCEIRYNGRAENIDPDLMTTYSGVLINSGANLSASDCLFDSNTPYNIEIANSGRTSQLWEIGQNGHSEPIVVSGLEIRGGEFNHHLPMDCTVYCPQWLDPEWFWGNSIAIGPRFLADQIIPRPYRMTTQSFEMSVAPNPSNATIILSINLPEVTDLRVDMFDILGRRVQQFEYDQVPVGVHKTPIDGSNLASGTYFVRVHADQQQIGIQKVMFLK